MQHQVERLKIAASVGEPVRSLPDHAAGSTIAGSPLGVLLVPLRLSKLARASLKEKSSRLVRLQHSATPGASRRETRPTRCLPNALAPQHFAINPENPKSKI
ncbi:hypothetical protein I8748_15410 [Nostoc sp. CENA67]|uniref:Uncharacterized protein n=1 Tax=Amazonocrinis nigriterrae CENA67 TaxID=2794033 RepID=A0A8J7HVT6_9NOST|nr:hypothetical protein [Amazonocrinis nigriterrae]MBH8563559.1 hypothetical protein [Amazonocrinis nigriterrae CENA67]